MTDRRARKLCGLRFDGADEGYLTHEPVVRRCDSKTIPGGERAVRRVRRSAAPLLQVGPGALTGLALCLVLTGCGGSDPQVVAPQSDPPSPTPSSATPTTAPTAAPTQEPLSPFESRRPVQAARKFLAANGRAINARDPSMKELAPFVVPGVLGRFYGYAKADFGRYYPGPLPFTPVAVRVSGSSASLPGCLWTAGWAQKRSTRLPDEKRAVTPVNVSLRKLGASWKVADVRVRQGSCKGVAVKGVAW